jgi:hypothetical protein
MPVQVWLDTQGRARQISYQLAESTTASSASGTNTPAAPGVVTSTLDYYNFGVPVHVTAPPAAQVDDLTNQVVATAT